MSIEQSSLLVLVLVHLVLGNTNTVIPRYLSTCDYISHVQTRRTTVCFIVVIVIVVIGIVMITRLKINSPDLNTVFHQFTQTKFA
jgi:hypothetical protein